MWLINAWKPKTNWKLRLWEGKSIRISVIAVFVCKRTLLSCSRLVSGFIGKVPVTWLPGWDGTEAPELYQKKTFPLFCAPASCLVIPFVCIHFYECFRKNLLLAKKGRRALSLRKTNSQMQIAEDSSPSARILCKFIHKTMIIPLKMQTKVFLLCSHSRSATEKLRDIKSLCNGCRLRWSRVGRLLGMGWKIEEGLEFIFNCHKIVLSILGLWQRLRALKTKIQKYFLNKMVGKYFANPDCKVRSWFSSYI